MMERKRRRREDADYDEDEADEDEVDSEKRSNVMTAAVTDENLSAGMTPPSTTPMAMPSSSLETTSTTITPARKKLSLRPTNHITPTSTTSSAAPTATATSTILPSGTLRDAGPSKTWRIKIGSPTSSHSFKEKITPPVEWMCHTCCSGGHIPSLAEACDNCRRKGYSHRSSSEQLVDQQQHHQQQHQRLHLPPSMVSTVTPTRYGVMISGVSPHRIAARGGGGGGGGSGEEAFEMDVLDGDFDWNENEIDRAQMWQREHQQLESGGEENEVVNATTTSTTTTVASTSTPPTQ